jgi:glycerol-3-phosphate O-acyltransferase
MSNPRLGILSYIIDDFDPSGRDVVFVPVALNYDRVLEDRFLIKAAQSGVRRFRPPLRTVIGGVSGYLWARLRGKMTIFGTANVSFGQPLSLRDFAQAHNGTTKAVGRELMSRIASVIPILPVPMVSRAVLAGANSEAAIAAHIQKDLKSLPAAVAAPRRTPEQITTAGLANLRRRCIVTPGDVIAITDGEGPVLAYYANSIAHHFGASAAQSPEISATAKQ